MAVQLPMPTPHISLPRLPHIPPIWRESRFGLELASLRRSDVWRCVDVPHGDGRPVLLIPGFLAGDGSLGTMTQWLRRADYRTSRAGIRSNVGCSEASCTKLETRLEALADRYGQKVSIVGQSRGGLYAKALASRRPDLVSGIVTLGSPLRNMLAVHPLVLAQIGLLGAVGTITAHAGLLNAHCLMKGDCCERFRTALEDPFPEGVGYLSVYSRSDGIVDWRACLDPEADEHVEVRASHIGMGANAAAYRATAQALSAFGEGLSHPDGAVEYAQTA